MKGRFYWWERMDERKHKYATATENNSIQISLMPFVQVQVCQTFIKNQRLNLKMLPMVLFVL